MLFNIRHNSSGVLERGRFIIPNKLRPFTISQLVSLLISDKQLGRILIENYANPAA